MRTVISLPDDVFEQAERLARRLRKSRSELYRDAVAEFVARHEPDAVTEAVDRVADEVDTRPGPLLTAAANQLLKNSEW